MPLLTFLLELMGKTLTSFAKVLCDEIESLSRRFDGMAIAMQQVAPRSDQESNDEPTPQSENCDVSASGDLRAILDSSWNGICELLKWCQQVEGMLRFKVCWDERSCICRRSDCICAVCCCYGQFTEPWRH